MLTRHETITLAADIAKLQQHLCLICDRLHASQGDAIAERLAERTLDLSRRMSFPLDRCMREIAAEHSHHHYWPALADKG
jgi:hypothetical protein